MDNRQNELAARLGRRLKSEGWVIATAESCTGGLIAATLTDIPGSSAWFDRGFVTYSNQAKIDMLGIKPDTLYQHGAVSAETAQEMAAGALARSRADWAIAVTGIAGPDGGSADKPVGTVYLAWQKRGKSSKIERAAFSGNRGEIREQTVARALGQLLEWLDPPCTG